MKKLLIVILTMLSVMAMADEANSNWYTGFGLGQAHVRLDPADFHTHAAVMAAGYTENSYETTSSLSYDMDAGYRFTDHISGKLGYTKFGKQDFGANVPGGNGNIGNANSNIYIKAVSLAAVGTYPIYNTLSALGELGAYYYKGTRDPSHSGVVAALSGSTPSRSSDSGIKPYAAFGFQYDVNKHIAVIGKYTHYGTLGNSDTIGHITLNNIDIHLQYNF